MKVFIFYHDDPDAGINATSFELDLGDMFDVDYFDSEDTKIREDVRESIIELAILANDVPDEVMFEDEMETENVKWDYVESN